MEYRAGFAGEGWGTGYFPIYFFRTEKTLSLHRKSWKEKPRFSGFIFPQNIKHGKRYTNNKVAHRGADGFSKVSG
jgi:hypothetical protein